MGFNPNLIRTIDVEMRSSDIDALRNDLENYISKIIDYPLEKFNGKGIVFTAGGVTHVTCLWVSINILRELGCCLPIEIWHVGNEISADVMTEFAGLNVQFLDLNDYEIIDSPGYYVKPLAILHSTFKEVLYMDADNICCRNPEYLFQLEAYKTTGTVFWADYWFTDKENPIWKIVDCDNFGLREQESGQILINKEQCWRALNVCVYFNNLGRYYYRLLYGDKDTFKFSWVALKLEFHMIPHNPATCGELREGVFSGNTIVQFDQIGEPPIRLDEVVVTGFYGTGNSGSWDTGGKGASGFNYTLDMYIAYLGGYGHQFSGGNGSYTYIPSGSSGGTPTSPSTGGSQSGDTFKRENGQLVITSTGKTTDIDYIYVDDTFDDVILNFEEVNIKDKNGNDVLTYRVISYQTDADGPKYTDIPDKYKRNCHGSALGVDLWFNDIYGSNLRDVNIQEDQGFKTMMSGYTSNSSDSNVISFYTGSLLTHSVKRDPSTGELWSKTDHGETKHYTSLDAFFADGKNETLYAQSMRKYYKL